MRTLKWAFWILVVLAAGGFLTYTLPSNDIVRIVGSEVRRVEIGPNGLFWAGGEPTDPNSGNRDVKFISAVLENGKTRVYRNEDTGWRWPPYFKFDTATLQTQADDLRSTAEAPKWAVVTHYGWRNQFLSIFPNAVGIRPVAGPDVRIIPWVNIVILGGLLVLILLIRAMWRQFRERTIEPLIDEAADKWDELGDRAEAMDGKARGFWARLVGRGRK